MLLARLKPRPTYYGRGLENQAALRLALADGSDRILREAHFRAQLEFDRFSGRGIRLEEGLRVLAALAEALAAVGEPRAGLLDDVALDGFVEQITFARNAFAVHDVELGLAEGRGHLVLDHLHARAAADDRIAILDGADAADVHANRRIELQRAAARGGLGAAEH